VKASARQKGHTELYRGAEYDGRFLPKVKDRVVVRTTSRKRDRRHRQVRRTARSATAKIFVPSVEHVVRIRTGETTKPRFRVSADRSSFSADQQGAAPP